MQRQQVRVFTVSKDGEEGNGKTSEMSRWLMWYKFIWFSALLICLVLCTHQIINRINVYGKQPVNTVVKLMKNNTFNFPYFTICGNLNDGLRKYEKENGINFSSDSCLNPETEKFWQKVQFYNIHVKSLWNLSDISKQVSIHVIMRDNVEGIMKKISTLFGKCLTFKISAPAKLSVPCTLKITGKGSDISKCSTTYPKLLVHSEEDESKNIYMDTLATPLPYTTKGRILLSAKEFKNLNSTRNPCFSLSYRTKCLFNCIFNKFLNQNNSIHCKLPFMSSFNFSYSLPYCSNGNETAETYSTIIQSFREIDIDQCKCGRVCHEIIYTSLFTMDEKGENYSQFSVHVFDNVIESVEEIFSYDLISLMCDIGGNLGLYVGVCLLSLFEYVETIAKKINDICGKKRVNPTNGA